MEPTLLDLIFTAVLALFCLVSIALDYTVVNIMLTLGIAAFAAAFYRIAT